MAITKQKKEQIVGDLKTLVEKAKIIVFVNFHGLNNALSQDLRRLMSESDAKYLVAKKTLTKRVLDEFKFSGDIPSLDGELALVFGSGEITAPVKALAKFGKEHKEVSMLGGVFENSFVGKETISEIANLPSREVLIAQVVGMINAPRSGLVGTLSGVMGNFVNVLRQINK
jgi:large subunit ribosomal protein L10